MIRLLRLFFNFQGANPWMVVLCLIVANLAEGFGIASLVPLISIAGAGTEHADSLAGRMVVDTLMMLGVPATLEVLLVIVVLMVVLKAALSVLATVYVARAVAEFANGLRERLIATLLRARWSYFTSKPTGMLVNAVGLESTISGTLYVMVSRYVSNAIQTLVYLAVSFAVSWKLASAAIGIGAIVFLSLHYFVRMAEKAGRRNIRRSRELITRLSDAIMSIKPLRAMGREDEFARLFSRKVDQIRKTVRREMVSKSLLGNLQDPLVTIMLAGGFFVVVEYFGMPLATVLVVGILLQRTVNTVGKLQTQYQEAIAAESAYHSVRNMTVEADRAREPPCGTTPATFEFGCVFRHVSFCFGETDILRDLNLEIPVGKLTLVVGVSGSGKTTLTDLLLGFYRPDRGQILIDGAPLEQLDIRSWRRSIGYVPQELILLHDSIVANITLGDSTIDEHRVLEALRLAGAVDFVTRLPQGFATEVGEKGPRLSGGQRQRIALARALVHRPKLLILDEVTSALDAATEQEICENIRQISRSVTVLAISHRQAWMEIADQVFFLSPPESTSSAHRGRVLSA